MAIEKITFNDKSHVIPYGTREIQIWDLDINEIKAVVNNNADVLEVIEAQQFTGFVAVKLFADLPTPGVEGTGYYVLDDVDPANNGMWGYDTAYYQASQTVNSGDFDDTDNITPATQKSTAEWVKNDSRPFIEVDNVLLTRDITANYDNGAIGADGGNLQLDPSWESFFYDCIEGEVWKIKTIYGSYGINETRAYAFYSGTPSAETFISGETASNSARDIDILVTVPTDATFIGVTTDNYDYSVFKVNDYDFVSKSESIITSDVITNIATQNESRYAPVNLIKTDLGDDRIQFTGTSVSDGTYMYFNFDLNESWIANHKYYVSFDVEVITNDAGVDGNFSPEIKAKYSDPITVGSGILMATVVEGDRGNVKSMITMDETNAYPDANHLFVQFGQYDTGENVDVIFSNVLVTDLGEMDSQGNSIYTFSEIDDMFNEYGYVNILTAIDMPVIGIGSSGGDNPSDLKLIEGWGDSMMAQGWLSLITDRTTTSRGYGGEKTPYIRDQYLAGVTKTKTQVFEMGRNNYSQTDFVMDDLKACAAELGHSFFMILTPQNGGYTGEQIGGVGYESFIKLEDRLSSEYQNRYFNQRRAMIQQYDMGGIKLTSSFIQPIIGGNVQIEISSAHIGTDYEVVGTEFLNTPNTNDTGKWSSEANKITIGTLYDYDVYEIISVDSDTLITIQLLENNTDFSPSDTVDNIPNPVSLSYLKVCQKMDVFMWEGDCIQSTLRSDGVHNSNIGKLLKANLVSNFLKSLDI